MFAGIKAKIQQSVDAPFSKPDPFAGFTGQTAASSADALVGVLKSTDHPLAEPIAAAVAKAKEEPLLSEKLAALGTTDPRKAAVEKLELRAVDPTAPVNVPPIKDMLYKFKR